MQLQHRQELDRVMDNVPSTHQPIRLIKAETYAAMRRVRPRIERRARAAPGLYRGNLAREWRLLLVRMIPLE